LDRRAAASARSAALLPRFCRAGGAGAASGKVVCRDGDEFPPAMLAHAVPATAMTAGCIHNSHTNESTGTVGVRFGARPLTVKRTRDAAASRLDCAGALA